MKPIVFAALFISLASTSGALAHSKATTMPVDGETVASLESIAMTFDNPMRVTAFTVSNGDGAIATNSEQGTDMVSEYEAAPEEPVAPGDYTVEWRGLSEDGHPMQGSFEFTVAE